MLYEVYSRQSIIENLPLRIICIHPHGNRIYIGTSEGCLLVYQFDDEPSFVISLLESRKNFTKRPIEQLAVISNILILLSDGVISQYDAVTLAPRSTLDGARGSHLFAITTTASTNDTLPKHQLVAGLKRKLVLFECKVDGTCLSEISKEWTLPDKPRMIGWLDSERLFAIINKSVLVVNIITNEIRPLNEGAAAKLVASRMARPGVLPAPNGRSLVTREKCTMFVESDGRVLGERDIEWSEAPEYVVLLSPYVIGLVNSNVEVRSLRTRAVVQRLNMPGAKIVESSEMVYVASTNSVWRLLPIDFDDQIEVLISAKKFEEAQTLIEELDFPSPEHKISNIIRVKSLLAHHMFTDQARYEEAVALLQGVEASPLDVINLYPDIAPVDPESTDPVTTSDKRALLVLKDYLTNQRGLLAKLWRQQQQLHPNIYQSPFSNHSGSATNSQGPGSTWSSHSGGPVNGNVDISMTDLLYLSELVDTALLKVCLKVNDALVGPLVRVGNRVNLAEAETLLGERKKYKELLDLYRTRGLHRKALDLLVKQLDEAHPDTSDQLLNYLKRLGSSELDLVLEYLPTLIPNHSQSILRMLTDVDEDSLLGELEADARRKVLDTLDQCSPETGLAYLEHLVLQLNEPSPELHERLAMTYVAQQSSEPKLLNFLEQSTMYRPMKLLEAFPKDYLFAERVILYSRLDLHDEAIRIFVYDLEQYHLAEKYCRRHYDPQHPITKDIFSILYSHYMTLVDQGKIKMEVVLGFLSRYGMYLDVVKTIMLTSPEVKLSDMLGFVQGVWLDSQRKRHDGQVLLNLCKSDKAKKSLDTIRYQSRRVTITDDRMCSRCLKRIGNSAFGVYPNLKIAHVYCIYSSSEMYIQHP
ncbi:hypothetical protein SmJEL517_g04791 [Synchytrium microbalum]|uniref:CNH domain-containing protein n=1 Tax=Synchytrium microbalum TaxID=1806994 RepID=A0A507C262_9FUNG|nr:uncharacterized protein SmJEL517_g04791 [Synchytrium microbalum]TPX32046.1 hypothetical protein SmJEL517_g04791 [Synchytrium microbalum]